MTNSITNQYTIYPVLLTLVTARTQTFSGSGTNNTIHRIGGYEFVSKINVASGPTNPNPFWALYGGENGQSRRESHGKRMGGDAVYADWQGRKPELRKLTQLDNGSYDFVPLAAGKPTTFRASSIEVCPGSTITLTLLHTVQHLVEFEEASLFLVDYPAEALSSVTIDDPYVASSPGVQVILCTDVTTYPILPTTPNHLISSWDPTTNPPYTYPVPPNNQYTAVKLNGVPDEG